MPPPTSSTTGSRQGNLARILRLVHEDGAQSRADLTETTGLNRSTIADLVGELVRLGLVEERVPHGPGRVGRPSPVVAASPAVVAIVVNPEIDATEIAAVGLDRGILVRERIIHASIPTPQDVARLTAERIASWRRTALMHARIVSVGVAVPGLVRSSDGVVRHAPHLRWVGVPLAELVHDATGLSVFVDNDATLGAVAEHRYGAGRGIDDLVYLNGGASGIGGGIIIHGTPVTGAGGYAGEFGQNRPRISDDADRRTADGVLESEVNRRLLLDALGTGAGLGDESVDDDALAAALAGSADPAVAVEVSRQTRVLAGALANTVNALNPAAIVLGGFLATLVDLRHAELIAEIEVLAMPEGCEGLVVRAAALRADRLLIGAAELALAPLIAAPAGIPPAVSSSPR